ncbi:MAG: pitrilysin family protein [Candidatus Eisenbacteria bacterium]|nr:pitrilysin family protein [Candidatus Eisenbacteria bacterium]
MRKLVLALSLCFLVVSTALALAGNAKRWDKLVFPPQRELNIPEPQRSELPNGFVLYLLEDHELPLIYAHAIIKTGARWEPEDKVGLASITGTAMRTGGTAARTGDELDDELEALGAYVETAIYTEQGGASMSVLKEDVDKGLSILADVLQSPAFREDKIELAKIEEKDAIARRNDDPSAVADREFNKLIYGEHSPYARTTEYETIDRIKRDDLVAFHKRYFVPNNVILGIVGDFDSAEMRKKIETYFGSWKRQDSELPPLPEVTYKFRNQVCLIDRPEVNQTNVRLGHIGGKMNDPDYFALQIAGRIFGMGWTSRLNTNIRSQGGLAYAVWGYWGASYDYPGVFEIGGGTKSDQTVHMITALKTELEKMTTSEVTDKELKTAKDGILNSFVFNFDTKAKILERIINYEYFGYPKDFIFRYKANIEKVTRQDVLRVAKQHFHPGELVILAVGNETEFAKTLSSLGPVAEIDITIPEAEEEPLPEPTPETIDKAKDILKLCLAATGGKNVGAVKDITETSTLTVQTQAGSLEVDIKTVIKFPDRIFQSVKTPMGEMVKAYDGRIGWMKSPRGTEELNAEKRLDLLSTIKTSHIYILQNFEKEAILPQFLEEVEEGGKTYQIILIRIGLEDKPLRIYVEKQTGIISRTVESQGLMGLPGTLTSTYSDFRDVKGVKFPFRTIIEKDGTKAGETNVKEVKFNSAVQDSVFVIK